MMWFKRDLTEKEQEQIILLRMQIKELEWSKKQQEKEYADKKARLEVVHTQRVERMEHENSLKQATMKNEADNMKASLVLKHEQDIARLKKEFDEQLVAEKERLNKEFYERMTSSLSELHSKGNHTTDFLKEMTLKMLEKAPTQAVRYVAEPQ